jgi:hypothetical protein
MRHFVGFVSREAVPYLHLAMKSKSEIKRLIEAVRRAEAELDGARTLSDVKYAASVLMRARAELKAAQAAVAANP